MQALRQLLRRDLVLLRVIKTATVHGPDLAAHALVIVGRVLRRFEMIIKPDEIERRTNPCDAGDDMQPAHQKVKPVDDVGFHS